MSAAESHDVHVIDLHFQGRREAIAAYLLAGDGEAALVETGPASCADALLDGVAAAGVAAERVTRLLLTHIHLDHAGGAGSLLRSFPNARVCVHEAGARHLLDPSRLVASAARIYGDRMGELWGEVLPVPADRLSVLADGESVRAGGRELTALYTPGHASHHIAYWDANTGAVWTGDVGGVRLSGSALAIPPTPPPDLDLDAWSDSLTRLRALCPRALYLTHYGYVEEPEPHLRAVEERLYRWSELVLDGARRGESEAELADRLRAEAHADARHGDAETHSRYELVAGYGMNVAGYLRLFRARGDLPDAKARQTVAVRRIHCSRSER